jgi:hypothetical protein
MMAKRKRPKMTAEEYAKQVENLRKARERIAFREAKEREHEARRAGGGS